MMAQVMARAIVLKFGGSVLPAAAALPAVVAEIRRHRRDGFAVVAVVSAFAGRTDELLAACRLESVLLSPFAIAARAALGEREAAALLGAALDRDGVDAAVLDPAAIDLRATGDALDGDPCAVARGVLLAALHRHGVAVIPGFIAIDGEGRSVLLGRGGSDLTALFLAQQLGAPCRLLKAVGGLHAVDPAGGPQRLPRPQASWDELLATGGRLVQQKAVAFARAHGLTFEIAAPGAKAGTVIGPLRSDTACS